MFISIGFLAYCLRRLKSDCFPNRGDTPHVDAEPASFSNSNSHRDNVPHSYAYHSTLRNIASHTHPSAGINGRTPKGNAGTW